MRPGKYLVVIFVLVHVFCAVSCGARGRSNSNTIVLPYDELGPQVAVHELIGYEWYQWNSHGDSDPTKTDDVKVVVYRNIGLEEVKRTYPVIDGKQDFRYLDYSTAMDYLNRHEKEPYLEHLQKTKKKILAHLGE